MEKKQPHPHQKQENENEEIGLQKFTNDCLDIKSCKSLKRLILILDFYDKWLATKNNVDTIQFDADDDLLKYMSKYKHLLNDFGHILSVHLNNKSSMKNDKTFLFIHNECCKYITCSLNKCGHHGRNSRNRCKEIQLFNNKDLLYYIDILDTIHVYFLHSFDTGFRSKLSVNSDIKSDDENNSNVEDKEMIHRSNEIKSRRTSINRLNNNDRLTNNKFLINNEDEEEKKPAKDAVEYSFGQKFYYDKKDENVNKYWCISKKYIDFKAEIINNRIFALPLTKYNIVYDKASKFLNESDVFKKYVADNTSKRVQIYLDVYHIISVILYTDYTKLSYHFTKSFRKLNNSESNKDFKQRKREFYFFSKILTETVETFGTKMIRSKADVFYTGISHPVMFNSFIAKFYSPTSTTRQLNVALVFAKDDGIILELERLNNFDAVDSGWYLKQFNASLISCFSNEDERLFIGGFGPLQFRSIRIVRTNQNYFQFIDAMKKFTTILNGQFDQDHKCKKKDGKIVNLLIKHNLKLNGYINSFPEYINNIFNQFAIHRKQIYISMIYYLRNDHNNNYILFSKCLFSESNKYLLKYNLLSILFPKCERISIDYDFNGRNKQIGGSWKLFLSQFLKQIEEINKNGKNSLKVISIRNHSIMIDDDELKKLKNSLNEQKWNIKWKNRKKHFICAHQKSAFKLDEVSDDEEEKINFEPIPEELYIGNLHKMVPSKREKNKMTHQWKLFVSKSRKKLIKPTTIKEVIYSLHPTYNPSVIAKNKSPFYLVKKGWGVFQIKAEIVFNPKYKRSKNLIVSHMLSFDQPANLTKIENGNKIHSFGLKKYPVQK